MPHLFLPEDLSRMLVRQHCFHQQHAAVQRAFDKWKRVSPVFSFARVINVPDHWHITTGAVTLAKQITPMKIIVVYRKHLTETNDYFVQGVFDNTVFSIRQTYYLTPLKSRQTLVSWYDHRGQLQWCCHKPN